MRTPYDLDDETAESGTTLTSGIGIDNPIRYRSYVYDDETGFYYLGSRYYDPTVGRFINADDDIYNEDFYSLYGYNLFSYCDNNPINKVDPSGHFAVAATIGAANFWNPVGWIVLGATAIAAGVTVGIALSEHRKNARKSTWDKHTKKRPGRSTEKKKQKKGWKKNR